MIEIPVIETDRLLLRALNRDDFEAEAEFFASDRSKFVGGPIERAQAWRKFAAIIGHWELRGYGYWAVDEKQSGNYCGRVGLWYPEDWPEPEIGWALMSASEGRGIAHEAAVAAREYAYSTLEWSTAISLIFSQNLRSAALAQKLGAVAEYSLEHSDLGEMIVWRHPDPAALSSSV